MRALGELVVLAAIVAFVVVLARAVRDARGSAARRWRVDTRTRPDGTLLVVLARGPGDERVVRALPPDLEPAELAAELQMARAEADLAVRELNRGS